MKKYGIFLVSLMFLGFVGTAQAGSSVVESLDSPSEVILPDCSTVDVSTSWHSVEANDILPLYVNNFNSEVWANGTIACDGNACALSLPDMDDIEIGAVVKRRGQGNKNSTPAKFGKTKTDITCLDCPDDTVDAQVGTSFNRKNAHFDIDLEDGDNSNAFVCTVGLNIHSGEL